MPLLKKLEALSFDNSYARLPGAFYESVHPTPFPNPFVVSVNRTAAELLDLDPGEFSRPEFAEYFCGARLLPGSQPVAMLYSGHQFGQYVSQLGDGRAILLGEVRNQQGKKWDLQLKGAGLTRFSRDGDGRAVLRSTIREYLCGEALHGLGIPTTRSLCIISGDETVYRETAEPGAMLVRLAQSHVRFGSFEVFYYRHQYDHLRQLADYVIGDHFPHLGDADDRYARFLHEISIRTGHLIAQWQAVGWAHGVVNTDNMSILGLTLDYGPFGFMEAFNPGFICNHSDHYGRYAFQNQPDIGYWNIRCLAQALSPLMNPVEVATAPDLYKAAMIERYADLMRAKMGLFEQHAHDDTLVTDLLRLLYEHQMDYTAFFRSLGEFQLHSPGGPHVVGDPFLGRAGFHDWGKRYTERLHAENSQNETRKREMNRYNPTYVLRNHLAQRAIDQAINDQNYSEIDRLLTLFKDPYTEQAGMEDYAVPSPPGTAPVIVSCSS